MCSDDMELPPDGNEPPPEEAPPIGEAEAEMALDTSLATILIDRMKTLLSRLIWSSPQTKDSGTLLMSKVGETNAILSIFTKHRESSNPHQYKGLFMLDNDETRVRYLLIDLSALGEDGAIPKRKGGVALDPEAITRRLKFCTVEFTDSDAKLMMVGNLADGWVGGS